MKTVSVNIAAGSRIPILLSVPHCGTAFPDELINQYKPDLIVAQDDTDWFVNQLYDFAPSMGITVISAVYSRWVIDLNRDPENKPLYSDGRIITGLCPVTNFLGESLYTDDREGINVAEIERRVEKYYRPYHQKMKEVLENLKAEFGKVLLWDCHSIRQNVKTICKEKFPDLILGDADGVSASAEIIRLAFQNLKTSSYSVSHNFPFKGGFITRHYGKPLEDQHALQLEMSKINYMNDTETQYNKGRSEKMRGLLKRTLSTLAESITKKV